MRTSRPHPAHDERGFILVGVVTFMLALTILGLSLFALSSYEAQFFVASAAREQSLQNSESGMELVKELLAAPNSRLEFAHRAEGQVGITSAMAYQQRSASANDTTSSGPIDWSKLVVIVVSARSGGVVRTIQASFQPTPAANPYQLLLAAGLGVSVNTEYSQEGSELEITGGVWQPVASSADTAWTLLADWPDGRPIQRGTPPVPLAVEFVAQHAGAPEPEAKLGSASGYELRFDASPQVPTYYTSPPKPTAAGEDDPNKYPDYYNYAFYTGADLSIRVRGIAVWVVPNGICFKDRVTVSLDGGSDPSTLVIVATANGNDPNFPRRGICFKGGLVTQSNTRVFLVSEGDITLIHHNDADKSNDAPAVSIVAGGWIDIGGPKSGERFRLGHDPSMDADADRFMAQGALPLLAGGTGASFIAARPTWSETTPR